MLISYTVNFGECIRLAEKLLEEDVRLSSGHYTPFSLTPPSEENHENSHDDTFVFACKSDIFRP
jgi:hypothetical protein